LVKRGLDQNCDPVLLEPVLVRRHHARPGPAAASTHLASLDGEIDLVAAGITGRDPQFRSKQRVEQLGELIGVRGGTAASDDQFLLRRSSKLAMPVGVPATQTLTSLLALPIQLNSRASN
jgi:hypothetical protein